MGKQPNKPAADFPAAGVTPQSPDNLDNAGQLGIFDSNPPDHDHNPPPPSVDNQDSEKNDHLGAKPDNPDNAGDDGSNSTALLNSPVNEETTIYVCIEKCFFNRVLWKPGKETAYIEGIENSPYFKAK